MWCFKVNPLGMKLHRTLEGTILIGGWKVKVLFDTVAIGTDLISVTFVATHKIKTADTTPVTIMMAMKRSTFTTEKEITTDITTVKLISRNNVMMVGYSVKYNALIGIPFLMRHGAIIQCGNMKIEFPNARVTVNCTPTSSLIQAMVSEVTHNEILTEYEDVFPEVVLENLQPMWDISHDIQLKDATNQRTLPTYMVPEVYLPKLSSWLEQKLSKEVIYQTKAPGAVPLFVQPKTDGHIRLLVDLTSRNFNTLKDDIQILNQKQMQNTMAQAKYHSKIPQQNWP
jgi:hypothetical protein